MPKQCANQQPFQTDHIDLTLLARAAYKAILASLDSATEAAPSENAEDAKAATLTYKKGRKTK